ncbi:MAG TPA: CPBP family intramembrane metalloprotease [Candidatus Eremiobacteraeota bacterium]|mgnify:FL=1|nr:MAG: CAAX amino terminal protease self- immunity [bacterium ADurb.Bin363]HPZ10188.1 CPBP family intramembrane metalloprotease [Candidatus Eremiobacteraeota bacterium]
MIQKNEKPLIFLFSLILLFGTTIGYLLVMTITKQGMPTIDIILSSGRLFSPELCLIFIIFTFLLILLFNFLRGLKRLCPIIYTIQICATGYFILEIIYQFVHFTLPLPQGPEWLIDWFTNFNIYLLDRSHQYIALIFILIVFYFTIPRLQDTTLHVGNINYLSNFLDPKKPAKWRVIAIRIAGWFFLFSIVFLLLKHKTGELTQNLYMIFPLFLGALNNSFIEEFLFRGIFLSHFKEIIDSPYANYLQAILFGLFHSQFIAIFHSIFSGDMSGFLGGLLTQLGILIIYTFLAWIFGRSALETGGIGTSTFMHTCVVMAIYLSKGMTYL